MFLYVYVTDIVWNLDSRVADDSITACAQVK